MYLLTIFSLLGARLAPERQPWQSIYERFYPGIALSTRTYEPFPVRLVDLLTFVGRLGLFPGQHRSLHFIWGHVDFEF
jgi:hypothetical protein